MIDLSAFFSFAAKIDFWTIAVAVVCNSACAIIGCYLVLRRMSLMGDAIGHAALAGIAVAFLLSGQTSEIPMFVGALTIGLITALLTQTLHTFGKVPEDSSMGVVFTSFFALGVLLISRMGNVHIDTNCVLFGDLDTVSLDMLKVSGVFIPRALFSMVPVLVLTILFAAVFWKELKITSFDPMLATAMGLSAIVVHYLLMGMVSLVTVSALKAVGAIVVIAMLIVPAATAHLLTDRLGRMMVLAVLVGTVAAVGGCLLAVWLNINSAGMMATVSGIEFAVAVVLAPRYGLLSKLINNARLGLRIVSEDIIATMYRLEEQQPDQGTTIGSTVAECVQFAGGSMKARLAIPLLRRKGNVERVSGGRLKLTNTGRELGESLVRSHRLWEAFLEENFDLPPDHLHEPASRIEHYIGPALQEKLARTLERSEIDPHGRAIPRSKPQDTST